MSNVDNQTAAEAREPQQPHVKLWRRWLERLEPFLALLIITVGFALVDRFWGGGTFLEWGNVRLMLINGAPLVVAALGMMLVIMTSGIDLSAGTVSALCATVIAFAIKRDCSVELAIVFAVLTGTLCGLFNGLIIAVLRIPPFIVTLGTMTVFLGIGKLLSNNGSIQIAPSQLPAWLKSFVSFLPAEKASWLPNIQLGVWVALLISLLVAILLSRTVFGRHIKAVGSNEATARLCGVNVFTTKLAVYALAGALFGMAGLYSFSLMNMANPSDGIGKELKYIAAVVIGGASLSGGRGSVSGTLAGVAITVVLMSGCSQLEASNAVQDIMTGLIIIAAVVIDQLRHRRT